MLILAVGLLTIFLIRLSGLPPIVWFVLSIVAIGFILNEHFKEFSTEYRTMSFLEGLRENAPVAMIVLSTAIALGYILLLKAPGVYKAPLQQNTFPEQRAANFRLPYNNQRQQNMDRQALLKALEYAV